MTSTPRHFFSAERVSMLLVIALLLALVCFPLANRCSHVPVSVISPSPDSLYADSISSIPADSLFISPLPPKNPKQIKDSTNKIKPKPYSRSHLEERL